MKTLKKYAPGIWRVPFICIIAGVLYAPLYVQMMVWFGTTAPSVLDGSISLLVGAGFLVATLLLGGIGLLLKQTKMEIFISAAVVSVYGLVLYLLQMLVGATTGAAALTFMALETPLAWAGFFTQLSLYLEEHYAFSMPAIALLRFGAPFLFVLFGRKAQK